MQKARREHLDLLMSWSELRSILGWPPDVEYLNIGVSSDTKVPDPTGERTQILVQGYIQEKPNGLVTP